LDNRKGSLSPIFNKSRNIIFRLCDNGLSDSDNLPPPDVIAQEIVADLEAALDEFRLIAEDSGSSKKDSGSIWRYRRLHPGFS